MEKNNLPRISVAIIGGGLSGSLLAINLLKYSVYPTQIFLIESSKKRFGRGVAYSPNSIYQKLNVPAKNMSLFPENPSHFFDWWKAKEKNYFYLKEKFEENSFFPRFIFGDYLETTLNQSVNNKPDFVDFFSINDEAIDGTLTSTGWMIKLSSGTELNVQFVVLATGNIPPSDPSYLSQEVLESKRYLNNPWDESLFESINTNESIGILGSGLSMVDVLMTLKRKDFQGKIVSFSRSGKLPKVHAKVDNQHPTNLPILKGKINEDVKLLRNWIRENGSISEAVILDVLRPVTSSIWQSWDTLDQLRFLRHLRPFWESFRHRIPEESMAMISDWVNSGKLTFLRTRIQSAKLENETISLFTDDVSNGKRSYDFNRLINCTGPDTKLKQVKSSLYSNLIEKGYLSVSPNGIGFKTISCGKVISVTNENVENLFSLGPLRKNELWESTALREIRNQITEVTSVIAEKADNEFFGKKAKFEKLCEDIHNLVPDPNMIHNLSRLLEFYSADELIQIISGTVGWIRPDSGYSRLKIMSEPFELLMMVWSPKAETAIHKHVGFGGILLILKGELIEKSFDISNSKIILSDEQVLSQGKYVLETLNSVHHIRNPSLDTYAISLHLYHPVVNSLTSMEIYDFENNRVGVLNENARSATWHEKGSSFKTIQNL